MSTMRDEQIDLVFKSFAHPERRRIMASLQERPDQSLFEICAASFADDGHSLSRQTISQHLEMLERAGLLEISWKGRTKTHSMNLGPLRAAAEAALNRYL
jgi:DNA-binding transcriptional ArsR family regulator